MKTAMTLEQRLKLIGDNLYAIRHLKRQKIAAVALSVGVSHPVISKVENGRYEGLTIGLLCRLAEHYDVSVESIVFFDKEHELFSAHSNNKQ